MNKYQFHVFFLNRFFFNDFRFPGVLLYISEGLGVGGRQFLYIRIIMLLNIYIYTYLDCFCCRKSIKR